MSADVTSSDVALLARSLDEVAASLANGLRERAVVQATPDIDTAAVVREFRLAATKAAGDAEMVAAAIEQATVRIEEALSRPRQVDVIRDDIGLVAQLIVTPI